MFKLNNLKKIILIPPKGTNFLSIHLKQEVSVPEIPKKKLFFLDRLFATIICSNLFRFFLKHWKFAEYSISELVSWPTYVKKLCLHKVSNVISGSGSLAPELGPQALNG